MLVLWRSLLFLASEEEEEEVGAGTTWQMESEVYTLRPLGIRGTRTWQMEREGLSFSALENKSYFWAQ